MAERILSVRLRAIVDQYEGAMKRAAGATLSVVDAGRSLDGVGTRFAAMGAGLTVAAGVGLRSAVSFESAFASVNKTVDGTEQQMASLEQGILDMAKTLPVTREEIAAVAAVAGQLGIATPNVLDFTRTMIDLGEAADDLDAVTAASALAQLANITQMSQGDFDRLGSSVTEVGNKLATTEGQIVDMATRIASAGSQIGLTEAEIVGFAGALSSVGIEAEAGGTAISTVMIKIAQAVSAGGSELEKWAAVAGMSGQQFSKLFADDAATAITKVISGMGDLSESGGDLFGVMESLGTTDVRVGNALRSLAGSGDLLTRSLDMSTRAWDENSALADEASVRYATTESRLAMTKNRISEVGRSFGDALIPLVHMGLNVIDPLAEGFGRLVDLFAAMPAPLQIVAGGILTMAVAVGPTILALTKLAFWLGGPLVKAAMMASPALANVFRGFAAGAMGAGSAAQAAGGIIGKAFLGTLAPAAAMTAALAAIAGGIWLAQRASEEFQSRNRTAAHSAEQLTESVGLATEELRAYNAEAGAVEDENIVSDQKFAIDNSDAIKTLRELKREGLAQGRLMEIAYRLQLQGVPPEEVVENVRRLAETAGIELPVALTLKGVQDFDNQVDSAVAAARAASEEVVVNGRVEINKSDEARLTNIAQMATDAWNTGNMEGFVRIMAESEQALGGNQVAMNYLSDEFLRLSEVQDVSYRNTRNFRDVLDELSRSTSVGLPDQQMFTGWLEATSGMGEAAGVARILELAATDAAGAVNETGGALSGAGGSAKTLTTSAGAAEALAKELDSVAGEAALARVNFDAGAASAAAFAQAMDMGAPAAARLSAGLRGGSALKSLREGMTGEKEIGSILKRAAKETDGAAKSVDRLSDAARRADPKMGALQVRLDALSAAGEAFSQSIDQSSMLDDQVESALNLGDAFDSFEKSYRRLPHTLDITAMATGKLRPRQVEAIQNTLALGKAARDYLATLVEMGKSDGEVRGEAAKLRGEYAQMFRQMGMNEEQVNKYLESMGLLPSQIDTAISLSGLEESRFKLNAYMQLLEGRIPPEVATSVVAQIEAGDLEGASAQLAAYARSNPAMIEVGVDPDSAQSAQDEIDEVREGLWDLPKDFDPITAVLGKYTDAQQAALGAVTEWGESLQGYLSTIAASGDADEIRSQADLIRDGVLEQLAAFGITGEAAQKYLDLLGLTPEQVETAIKLSGEAEAMFTIQLYADALAEKIPPEVWTSVLADVENGDLEAAAAKLAAWRDAESNKTIVIPVEISGGPVTGASYGGSSAAAELRGTGATAGASKSQKANADAVVARVRGQFGNLPIVDYTAAERAAGLPAAMINAANSGAFHTVAQAIRGRNARFPGFARGGRYPVGRDIVVGEEGIEILRLDQPGRILNNADTRHELTYPGTNVPVGSNVVAASGMPGASFDSKAVLDALRSAGAVTFEGGINVTSPVESQTPRRITEKVTSRLELAGR